MERPGCQVCISRRPFKFFVFIVFILKFKTSILLTECHIFLFILVPIIWWHTKKISQAVLGWIWEEKLVRWYGLFLIVLIDCLNRDRTPSSLEISFVMVSVSFYCFSFFLFPECNVHHDCYNSTIKLLIIAPVYREEWPDMDGFHSSAVLFSLENQSHFVALL